MKTSKRLLALLLACLMTVSMFAVTASAEGAGLTEAACNAVQSRDDASTYQVAPPPTQRPTEVRERESNDTLSYADRLSSNQAAIGKISSRGDKDCYRVSTNKCGAIDTAIASTGADVVYHILDQDGNRLASSYLVGQDQNGLYIHELILFTGYAGTYYFEVEHNNRYGYSGADYAFVYIFRPYVEKYVDVQPGRFYYIPVQWADTVGITGGLDYNHFGPNNTCTRAQLVSFLWRYAGCPEPHSSYNQFYDVRPSDYFYKAVMWAVENRITSGINSYTFGSYSPCTRAQMVTFLWNLNGRQRPGSYRNNFYDVDPGAYYYNAVLWAVDAGITSGVDAHHFNPYGNCTRAQAVTFLYNAP